MKSIDLIWIVTHSLYGRNINDEISWPIKSSKLLNLCEIAKDSIVQLVEV